jgi:hypothetical protein
MHFLQIDKLKLKTIRVLFPLHREGLTSYLSPILGQYAIKNAEFINDFIVRFNIFTKNSFKEQLNTEAAEAGGALYDEILFVPLLVSIYKGGKFNIVVNPPALGFLYSYAFKKRRRFYRNLFNNSSRRLSGLRNYKKLLQLSTFRFLGEDNFLNTNIVG